MLGPAFVLPPRPRTPHVAASDIVTTVSSVAELKRIPYIRQGDEEMYTALQQVSRRRNREAPK